MIARSLALWALFICSSIPAAAQLLPDLRKGEWHVLLIAATSEPVAGEANTASMEQAIQNFELIASTLGIKLFTYKITGSSLTTEGVKKGVRSLLAKEKPDEGKFMASVMSFTHGMNFPNSWTRLPFMVCHPTENTLNNEEHLLAIEDIYHSLRTFGGFDHVHVWAELCNNVPYGLEEKAPASQPFTHLLPQNNMISAKRRLEELLMGEKAIIMTSSDYGQVSYTFKNGGGVFTNSLFLGLENVANGKVDSQYRGTNGLFSFVKTHTQYQVSSLAGSYRKQTPQCYVGEVTTRSSRPSSNIVKAQDIPIIKRNEGKSEGKSPLELLKELWSPK